MATYVMSDIHGQYEAYLKMLGKIEFNEQDHLYIIGDVIDRGKYSIDIIKHIMEQTNITLLRGNHEQMMLTSRTDPNVRYNWIHGNGGNKTWKVFNYKILRIEQRAIYEYLEKTSLELYIKVAGLPYHLVHARPSWDDEEKLWGRFNRDEAYQFDTGDCFVITGHTPTKYYFRPVGKSEVARSKSIDEHGYITALQVKRANMEIFFGNGGLIGIDCGCAEGKAPGQLGCLRLEDWAEFYVELG